MNLFPCMGISELRLKIGQREQQVSLQQGQWKGYSWKQTFEHYIKELESVNKSIDILLNIYKTNCEVIFELGFDIEMISNLCTCYIPIDGILIKDSFHIIEAICKGQLEAVVAFP